MAISALLGPAIQGTLGLAQGIIGGIGMAKLAKKEPKYEIPKEVGEAVGMARGMAAEGMPAAQRTAAMQDIQQSAMMGMAGAQSRRGGLMSAQNIQAGMDRSTLNLAAQDTAMRQQNQRFAYSALMAGANYADKAFANSWQSFANKMQQRRALLGAGIQNLAGVAENLSTRSLYDKIYGTSDTNDSSLGGRAASALGRFASSEDILSGASVNQGPQELPSNMRNTTGGRFLWGK
jgi:hypothetical protein